MNREEMIIYWRDAAEKAEAKVIEQREEMSRLNKRIQDLQDYLEITKEQGRKNYSELCRLQDELEKRGSK